MANTRLVAILCTLLLLQEFGQATRPGHVCSSDNKELRVNNYEDLDVDDDEENEYDGSADGEDSGKNNIAQHYKQSPALHIAGRARFISPKLIFKGFKIFSKFTNFVVSFVSLTAAVYRAIEGCCGDLEFPEACTFKEKFEAGKNRVKKDSKTAEELQNKGELDQIWVRSNIEEYERITKRLKAISNKQEMLVKDISPNVKVAMKNASADIKYLMKEEVNKTVNGVKAQGMLNMYNSKVENAINIAFPAIALAFPAGVKIFNYAKERFSPRKLQDLAALDNVDLELPSTSATSKKSNKIAKFYGKFKGKIAAAKQKLKVRYEKAFTVAKRFKAGLELAFGFASAGLQAFYLIKERKKCKEMAEQAEAAYKNVTLAEQKIKANLNDIRDHLRIMEEAWNYVRGNMSDQTFLDSLTDVKKLTDDLAKTNTEMTGVSTSIDNFVSNIETSDGYNQTFDLAKDLATNLLNLQSKHTMKRLFHAFVAILCVLLLLQEFGQAHGPASRSLSRKETSGEDSEGVTPVKDDVKNKPGREPAKEKLYKAAFTESIISFLRPQKTKEQSPGKKGWAGALFKGFKIGVKVTDSLLTGVELSAAIYHTIKGCAGPLGEPNLETYQRDFETVRDEVKTLSERADKLQQEAERDHLWVEKVVNQFNQIVDGLIRIDKEQENLIKAIHPSVRDAMRDGIADIKTIMKKNNNTANGVVYTELLEGYNSALENALSIGAPATALAFPAARRLYQLVKKRQAARKIMEISVAENVKIKASSSMDRIYQQTKIGRFIGSSKARISNMKRNFKSRFATASKLAGYFKKGLKAGFGLARTGFGIFMMIKSQEHCAKVREHAYEALGEMTKSRNTISSQMANITRHLDIMDKAWGYLKSNITDGTFLDSVSDVGEMVDDLKERSDDMKKVATGIKNFVRDIKGATSNYNLTFELAKKLKEDLKRVPFTVSCYSAKYRIINRIIAGCKQGQGGRSFDEWYNKEQSGYEDNEYDPENPDNCVDKVGFRFIRKQDVESALIDSAQRDGFSTNCKLNDKKLVELVCFHKTDGGLSNEVIYTQMWRDSKLKQEDIKELVQKCTPSTKHLSDKQKQEICWERKTRSNQDIAKEERYQLQKVEAVTCPWPLMKFQKRMVCFFRDKQKKTDAFIADKLKVDVSQVAAVTCPRPSKDSSKKHRRRG
ncbi:uncharacterized protein LOC116618750 isoform X2 [Nematostella vectensis]|uniref:uncharacterized protein LOC116618750 isoform X1 n=1 Tax=Nematostella vectensis TaxID=45351 RepID=UPI0020772DF1|nr:uncharacterized protein LOC116618750 isoform X1 [Nematostella vectensis]XP_048584651.1 uncharacterized protein LOC116618750 isoform X2 [Nematostella vectensis]